ncbi:MAG: NAD(P)H-dependent oxidoreductase [Oscillospiraceae bacterium]|nr:NAD(P)H-dependent oxidoreductase [Oscillospiraceae bacterium]
MSKNFKKNAVIFFGSPRENGFTAKLTEKFMMRTNEFYNFVKFSAYKEKIKPCIACGFCNSITTCIYKDFEKIDCLVKKSDTIIIASPIYNMSLPSPLKSVIDRMQPYFASQIFHKENLFNCKEAILILTLGSKNKSASKLVRQQLKPVLNSLNAKILGQIVWENTDRVKEIDDFTQKNLEKIIKLITNKN